MAKMTKRCRDVLITDINMNDMDGRTLCPLARKMYPDSSLLILVMTSLTALDERSWVRQVSNADFLEKPLSPRQLVARLARYFTSASLLLAREDRGICRNWEQGPVDLCEQASTLEASRLSATTSYADWSTPFSCAAWIMYSQKRT
ncbi:PleD family two-component system response regulator [Pseudoduganella sp. SL102]|uniref:response regulator n=1 Tax=Pseudoduganella sp. SL102 TaxID=2995154 RepID=UPI0035A3C358